MSIISEELLSKVRRIELASRKIVNDVMTGQYRSHFKGQGVQFSEHRLYTPGDDVRHIDWKVSARSRDPVLKKYEEERELTVLLVVDVSGSKDFGTHQKLKAEAAAEIGAMVSYAAVHTGDKVGVIFFAGEVENTIPPRKGRKHVLRMIRDILAFEPKTKGTNLKAALESANRVMKHAGIVFVISDFLADDYELALRKLARKNDVVAVWVQDKGEVSIPKLGVALFQDPESGEEFFVDTSSYRFDEWMKEFSVTLDQKTQNVFKTGRTEFLKVSTHEDYAEAVVRFFQARNRKSKK